MVALTDHDTTAGWADVDEALPPGLQVVGGAEFSTALPLGEQQVSVHLLGYLFDPADPAIVAEQQRLRTEREQRGLRMAEKMNAAGLPITAPRVLELADGAPVGRPHLAMALIEAGVVATVGEAFAGLLDRSSPYYVAKRDTETREAVRMVVAAGGVAVVAHPRGRSEAPVLTPAMLAELAGLGLAAIEVEHIDHDEAERRELRGLAGDLGLLTTGSSDYHGSNKTVPIGAHRTDPEVYAALLDRADGRQRVYQR